MTIAPTAALRTDDYVEFCEGIRRLCEIDLLQYKRGQMERRILSFATRRGLKGLDEYLALLRSDAGELDLFLDRITINVSQLWRNPEQWRMLAERVLPELAAAGRIRAWSAGCSYGAEAYTLAAVCRAAAPGARIEVRGTDIDVRMVERAREGRFTDADTRTAPPAELARFFERDGDEWRAARELRDVCRFEQGDLLRMRFPVEAFDLVLCRNTVIYFTEPVRDELHRRLAAATRTGGYLMVGSTERVASPAEMGLFPAHPFTYRKV
jgi:chemotaxis protein methyltransferase CheR